MKKILSAILCVAMGAMLSLGVAGCSGSGGNDINPDADTTLKVSVYAAGYGTGWIEEACRIYSEDHPEVGFTIEANNRMFDTIKTRLETGTCDSDIVLIAPTRITLRSWRSACWKNCPACTTRSFPERKVRPCAALSPISSTTIACVTAAYTACPGRTPRLRASFTIRRCSRSTAGTKARTR